MPRYRAHVLVVDDSQYSREYFCTAIQQNHTPLGARSCAEALNLMKQYPIDVAVIDYKLPDGSGLTLLSQLRVLKPGLQVLLVSGDMEAALADPLYQSAGIRHVLSKPIKMKLLLDEIDALIEEKAKNAQS